MQSENYSHRTTAAQNICSRWLYPSIMQPMSWIKQLVCHLVALVMSCSALTSGLGGLVLCVSDHEEIATDTIHDHSCCHAEHSPTRLASEACGEDTHSEQDDACCSGCDDVAIPRQPASMLQRQGVRHRLAKAMGSPTPGIYQAASLCEGSPCSSHAPRSDHSGLHPPLRRPQMVVLRI